MRWLDVLTVILGIIVVIIVIVAGAIVEKGKGEKDMIKHVYIYLVLFATLMMSIGGSVGAFMAVADIVSPAPYEQTFEEFKRISKQGQALPPRTDAEDKEQKADLSQEELKAQYEAMVDSHKEDQIARAKNSLVKSFGWIIIPLPVFLYFQRRLVHQKTESNG